MLPASRERIESMLSGDDLVLDVGGWAKPFPRADWVLDLMPYSSRGLYGALGDAPERFSAATWVERDVCDRDPWPFEDGRFDFAICSHTLEDLRDPVWVCAELQRVARAGYIEVPSRLEEQAAGIHGPWIGWSHHRWLVDVAPDRIDFVFKSGVLQGRPDCTLPAELAATLTAEERVQPMFWEGRFEARERVFVEPAELDRYLADGVGEHRNRLAARVRRSPGGERLRRAARAVRRTLSGGS